MTSPLTRALNLVLDLDDGTPWTAEAVRDRCERVTGLLSGLGQETPDPTELVREVEARVNVLQDTSVGLVDPTDHEEWLLERKTDINWSFWDRYRRYLETEQTQPRAVVLRLDDVTDSILRKLEDPARPGPWDRRGLVVGQVQSGKTSNYTGIICKAADAGYKLILVLAGIHNSLRSQTQLRLDEGFLGFDTQYRQRNDDDNNQHRIGTGALPGFARLKAASLTTSAENGDFRTNVARSMNLPIGDYPVVLVVKKHTTILSNIHTWVEAVEGYTDPATGRRSIPDIPLLVIDDEADNASIDTSQPDADPTKTNLEIRRLLNVFDKSAYVGYTATPYANIYSATGVDHKKVGDDLFPRSFIESLRPPSNYMGAERVFGLAPDGDPPLPIHRPVRDELAWMPARHEKSWRPPDQLPASLHEALRAFLLTCAARRARGRRTTHNSMLVHVTRFQDVQEHVADQLKTELLDLQDRLRYGDGARPDRLLDELQQLWETDFVPTSARMSATAGPPVDWQQVSQELIPAATRIQMRTLNGKAKEALEYYENRAQGLSVVAVGGNKLSRGLTLEGLSVSYYLRASRMYDTLLQMGRWFGYRPGYEDLCRLYTTPELRDWYQEITLAQDELRADLEEMAGRYTPEQYGLRVRTSSAGLTITAANKMRNARRVRLSFSGKTPETITFDIRSRALQQNLQSLDGLLRELEQATPATAARGDKLLWRGISPETVAGFLERYIGDPGAVRSRPDLIGRFIRNAAAEFPAWDVVLISNASAGAGHTHETAAGTVGMITRALLSDIDTDQDEQKVIRQQDRRIKEDRRYTIRRILSPADELLNLEPAQREKALRLSAAAPPRTGATRRNAGQVTATGPHIRAQRRPDQGLVILYVLDNTRHAQEISAPMVGVAVSFPHSADLDSSSQEYAVNLIWQQLELHDLMDESDDDAA